jgi:hypothetical protein
MLAALCALLFAFALPAAAQATPATATCSVDDFTFGAGCSVTFPDTATGDTSTITVTLNAGLMSGSGPVALSSSDPYYTLSNDTCTGTTLSMGGSCTFDLVFAPLDDGTAATHSRPTAGLDVSEGGMPDGTLNVDAQQHTGSGGGGGTPSYSGSVAPASKDFGSATVGAGVSQTFTLTGTSTDPLHVTAVALGGTDAGDYTIDSDTCTGATLNQSDTCAVGVTFAAPSSNGPQRASSATLAFTSNVDTAIDVALSGTVLHQARPGGTVTAGGGSFSGITAGATATQTFRVTGTSADAVTLGASSVTGADRADYAVTGDDCNGRTLNSGDTCDIAVRFAPSASSPARSSTAELDVASNASAAISAPLSGTVVAAPAPSPGLSHTADSRSVHFRNTGNVPLHLTGAAWTGQGAENMTIVSDGCKDVTLAVGATCDVVPLLKWVAYGRINAYLTVGGDATDSYAYSLPDSLYSNIPLSASPADGASVAAIGDVVRKSYSFHLNNGLTPVRVASVVASGDSGFSVVNDGCRGVILNGGDTCTVDTTFTITSSGSHTGTLKADGELLSGGVSVTYVVPAPQPPAAPAPSGGNLTQAIGDATKLLQNPKKFAVADSGSGLGFDLDGDHVTVIPSTILKDNAVTTVLHAEPGDTIMLNGVKLDAAGIAALQKRVQAHVYQLKTMTGSAAAVRKSQIKLLGKTCANGRCKLRLQIPKTPGVYASTIGVSHKATGKAEAYPVVAVVVPKLTAPASAPACVTRGQRASTSSVKLGVTPATKVSWTLSAAARQPHAPRGCGDSRKWPALKASAATLARGAVAGSGTSRTTSMAKILNKVRLAKLKPGFYRVRFGAASAGMRSAPLDWWIQVLPREAVVGS